MEQPIDEATTTSALPRDSSGDAVVDVIVAAELANSSPALGSKAYLNTDGEDAAYDAYELTADQFRCELGDSWPMSPNRPQPSSR